MQPGTEQSPRLCDFLREQQHEILARWGHALRCSSDVPPAPAETLPDHLPELLERLGDVVCAVHGAGPASLGNLPDLHAHDRLAAGLDLRTIATELHLLRDVTLELWEPHARGRDGATVLQEIRQFARAVDEVIARSVAAYARARERRLAALDRVSAAALQTRDLDPLLASLLRVLLETIDSADSVYLLLRDEGGEVFRVRAADGTLAERSIGFSVRPGEGFAGAVVKERRPLLLHDASSSPLVLNPALRGEPVHALYGVPLVHGGEVVGVAKLASRSAYDFSDGDKHLLLSIAERATSAIVESQLAAREREAVAAVRRSDEELRHVLALSPDLLAIVGADGYMKRINPAFGVVLGHSDQELLARPLAALVHPDDREKVRAEVEAILGGTPSRRFLVRLLRKDGGVRCVSFDASAEPGADTFVAVGRDVTEERERAEFEQQLIGIVSHDLRNPLNTILLSTTVLMRRADGMDAPTGDAVRRAHAAAERATALIRDLLDFTRARTADGIAISPLPLDLHPLARGVAEDVCAFHPGCSVHVEQRGDGRGVWDPSRVSQLVENLVSNAFKYGDRSVPVVVRTVGEEGAVRLEVHNEGSPVDPALLPHLFEPLRQGKRTGGVGGVAGVGLGLYIVDRIVRAHGGTIEVRSAAPGGTTFVVRLPRRPAGP